MPHKEFGLRNTRSRLVGLAKSSREYRLSPELGNDLDNAANLGCTSEEELAFFRRCYAEMKEKRPAEARAWMLWEQVRNQLATWAAHTNSDSMTVGTSGEVQVVTQNLQAIVEELRDTEPRRRVFVVLAGIMQFNALFDDHIVDQICGGKKGLKKIHPDAPKLVTDVLDLTWYPGVSIPLSRVRHAWSHGAALILPDRLLVLSRDRFQEEAVLTVADLERYLHASFAAWGGFNLDLAATAALEQAQTGTVAFHPQPQREANRRLPDRFRNVDDYDTPGPA